MNSRLDRITDWEALAHANYYCSSAIAQCCGITVRQLERFFQVKHGCSPHKWLREKRMQQAVKLLTSGLAIKEVRSELGYKDVAHFTHDFKEYFGVNPGHCDPKSITLKVFADKCRVLTRNVAFIQIFLVDAWNAIVI